MTPDSTREIGGEIERLNQAITGLTEAVRDLRTDMITIRENIRSDFLRLVDRQDSYFEATRENMRTGFSRLIDRQDSHFRWLFGLMAASAIAVASLIFKSLH